MGRQINSTLKDLKEQDIYSLMLFVLFKLRDIPEYSTLSELAYLLDKDNLLKLCEYFGGMSIKVPKIEELEDVVNSLILYEYVNVNKYSYEEAVKLIGFKSSELRKIKSNYQKVCNILSNYNFESRNEDD